jgi:hypothetical protein
MGIHIDLKAILLAFAENLDDVVHEIFIIFATAAH